MKVLYTLFLIALVSASVKGVVTINTVTTDGKVTAWAIENPMDPCSGVHGTTLDFHSFGGDYKLSLGNAKETGKKDIYVSGPKLLARVFVTSDTAGKLQKEIITNNYDVTCVGTGDATLDGRDDIVFGTTIFGPGEPNCVYLASWNIATSTWDITTVGKYLNNTGQWVSGVGIGNSGDGIPEIQWVSRSGQRYFVYQPDGNGGWSRLYSPVAAYLPTNCGIGGVDVDEDGDMDFITGSAGDGTTSGSTYLTRYDGTSANYQFLKYGGKESIWDIAFGQVDNDMRYVDIVYASQWVTADDPGYSLVTYVQFNGTSFDFRPISLYDNIMYGTLKGLACYDFDADGYDDVIAVSEQGSIWRFMFQPDTGTWLKIKIATTGMPFSDVVIGDIGIECTNVADLNGDCKVDFVDFAEFASQWLSSATLLSEQLGYWAFEEGTGSRANDSAGTNEYLWMHNTTTYIVNWVTGIEGGAVEFSGNGSCFLRRDQVEPNLIPTEALTLSAYVNPDAMKLQTIISMGQNLYQAGISYKLGLTANGAVQGYIGKNYVYTADGIIDSDTATWQFVEFTYDDLTDMAKIYVDGEDVTLDVSSDVFNWGQIKGSSSCSIFFGREYDSAKGIYSGKLDEVKLSNTVIGLNELVAISNVDYNKDRIVNFQDFAEFTNGWINDSGM